jgi:hypothetical protein
MSVVSLSSSTRLDSFPNPRPKPLVADSQLDDIRNRVNEVEMRVDGELEHANQAFNKINGAKRTVNFRINATDKLQDAWGNYGNIVATALLVLAGVELSKSGWRLWKWFKAKRDYKEITVPQLGTRQDQNTDPFDTQVSNRRLHAREWKVSST